MIAFRRPDGRSLLLNCVAVVVSVLFGLMAVVLPWWFVVALLVLPLGLLVSALFPEMGLVLVVVLVSGLLPEAMTPSISAGPGKLQAHEIVMGLLTVIGAFRVRERGLLSVRWVQPVYAILLCAFIGSVVGLVYSGAQMRDLLQEVRIQGYWLLAPMSVVLIQDARALKRFIVGILIVSFLISVAVLLQFFFNIKILSTARVENLNTLTESYSDVTRSTAGGAIYWIIFSVFIATVGAAFRDISRWIVVPLVLVMTGAIVVSFGRGIWISMLMGAILLGWMTFRSKGVFTVLVLTIVLSVSAVGALATVKPRIIEVAIDRVISTTKEGDPNSSLGWRLNEANYAWVSLSRSPVIGIGFGVAYKPFERLSGTDADFGLMRYIHNSFLGVWLKMGLLGLLAVFWIGAQTLYMGWDLSHRAVHLGYKRLAATIVASFTVPLITSMTQPEWLAPAGVTYFALMIGILAVASRLDKLAASGDMSDLRAKNVPRSGIHPVSAR